eukprot:symbB.v1.2.013219.t1/scaffold890.1/size154879/5
MSEVARGSWGLVRATDEDLKLLDGDPEDRWAALWQDRAVLQREGSDSRPDARATSVRRGHDEVPTENGQTNMEECYPPGN